MEMTEADIARDYRLAKNKNMQIGILADRNCTMPEEIEKEETDPSVLENEARRSFLGRLRKELDFDKMVCEMEGISIQPFINSIRAVLREYDTTRVIKKKDGNQLSLFGLGNGEL